MRENVFIAKLPLWTVVDRARFEQSGVPIGIFKLMSQDFGPILLVFTQEDLAERFIDDWISPVVKIKFAIETRESLLKISTELEKAGCKYVGIDISNFLGELTGRFHPIGEFIEDVSASQG